MTANKIIAKLLDEHKITGEEAVILIQECNKQETKIIHEYDVNKWNYPYHSITIIVVIIIIYFHLILVLINDCLWFRKSIRIFSFRRMWL